jgi:hypothetical protein
MTVLTSGYTSQEVAPAAWQPGGLDDTYSGGAAMAKGICSVEGCEDPIRNGRGWYNKHYKRWLKHGDPTITLLARGATPAEKFWPDVNQHGPIPEYRPELGPCWLWDGAKDQNGYGRCHIPGRRQQVPAHSLAYELLVGPIPEGLEPDHLCRVRPCVKAIANEQGPAHLEPVTHQENMRRGLHWQRRKTHCKYGHEFTEDNIYWIRGRLGNPTRLCRTCDRGNKRRRSISSRHRRKR